MSAARRLGLGTAQFGSAYGITNRSGAVGADDAARILETAQRSGIDLIDTAYLYAGSEALLGVALASAYRPRIVTKTPKFAGCESPSSAAALLDQAFAGSERSLGRAPYGLLLHDAGDLLGPHGDALWAAMERLKRSGRVERIGVSVYSGDEIDRLLERLAVDLVQVPWNPLDTRLADGGQLDRLKAAGVEVHGRSLFLQGLLLQPAGSLPQWLAGLRPAVAELDRALEEAEVSRLEGLLALALAEARIDHVLVGVTSSAELAEIAQAADRAAVLDSPPRFRPSRVIDPRLLNPARWPELRGGVSGP